MVSTRRVLVVLLLIGVGLPEDRGLFRGEVLRVLPVLDAGLATLVACFVVEFRVVVGMGDDEECSFDTEGVGVRCEEVEESVLPRRVGKASGIWCRPT